MSQLRLSQGLPVPHSALRECRPQLRGLRTSLLFGSVLAAGSRSPSAPQEIHAAHCRLSAAVGQHGLDEDKPYWPPRPTWHATRPAAAPNSASGAPGCSLYVLGQGSRRAVCVVGSETPASTPRPEAGAAKPGTRRAMPRPGICSLARCERGAWGQGQERGKSSPASTHPRRIFRAP